MAKERGVYICHAKTAAVIMTRALLNNYRFDFSSEHGSVQILQAISEYSVATLECMPVD